MCGAAKSQARNLAGACRLSTSVKSEGVERSTLPVTSGGRFIGRAADYSSDFGKTETESA
jgi:hypothetical protein